MSYLISKLRSNDLDSIKLKFIILYFLNVTDIIFTLFLVNTGLFMEANSLMTPLIYNKQFISLLIKVIVTLVLLSGIYLRMIKATEKQLYQSNIIIAFGLTLYGLINISHIVWSIMYLVR